MFTRGANGELVDLLTLLPFNLSLHVLTGILREPLGGPMAVLVGVWSHRTEAGTTVSHSIILLMFMPCKIDIKITLINLGKIV